MPANTTFTSGAVLTAQQMNNLPWGIVDATSGGTSGRGYARRTTNQTLTTTETEMTGLTVTWTAVTGRLDRVSFNCRVLNTADTQNIFMRITTGANALALGTATRQGSSGENQINGAIILSGLTGTQTYKIRGFTQTGSATLVGDSTVPATFIVEDMGPAS